MNEAAGRYRLYNGRNTMQYILLIYLNEAEAAKRSAEEHAKNFNDYMSFSKSIRESGHFKGGEPLEPVSTATTVRVKGDKIIRTDGPFAETREQLGGFYMIEAKDLDEAVSIAARIPDARGGSIEVRPVMQIPGA
jgi:hypothetical protein